MKIIDGYKFTAYFYDTRYPCEPGIDTSELYIEDKYIADINRVLDVYDLSEIDSDELNYIILIVPFNTSVAIRNVNPFPD